MFKEIREYANQFVRALEGEEEKFLIENLDPERGTVIRRSEPGMKLSFSCFGQDIGLCIETEKPLRGRYINYVVASSQYDLMDKAREEYGVVFDVCTECGYPMLGGYVAGISEDSEESVHVCAHCMRDYMDRKFTRGWNVFTTVGSGSGMYFITKDSRKKATLSKIRYERFNPARSLCEA